MSESYSIDEAAALTGLPVAVVTGVCAELASKPDHAQLLELCDRWGLGWQELQRLSEMRPRDLNAAGKGIAGQAVMISALAQRALAKKLSTPGVVEGMEPKDLSTIAKQQSDIAMGWTKDAPVQGGNTYNFNIGDIAAIRQMRDTQKPARARLVELGVPRELLAEEPDA